MTDSSEARRETLHAALAPRSIAVFGASDSPDKIGGRPLRYLRECGFAGAVYPINPHRSDCQGLTSYPDLEALPEVPHIAIVAVPGAAAVSAVERCAARGVKVAIVMSSGFGETASEEGLAWERRMVACARESGMRLVGPNTQGLANFGTGAVASFSTMYTEAPPCDGPVAIVSQSGAMSVVPYGLLRECGIGVRHSHATGNDADVNVSELASVVAQDPGVQLLLLYLESVSDPASLARTAEVAHQRGLPVVVLKAGRTAAGQEAARSHTGALANEDRLVDAFMARLGLRRVDSVREMIDSAPLYLKGWRPKGRRLVVISNSGAACVMSADEASRLSMPLSTLGAQTREQLGAILPSFATTRNPIDLTAALMTNSGLFSQILPVIASDAAADAFMISLPVLGRGYDIERLAGDAAQFAQGTGKPLVMAVPQPRVAEAFRSRGLVVFTTESEAIEALDQYLRHCEQMRSWQPRPTATATTTATATPQVAMAEPVLLNEHRSLALLAGHGIPVVPHVLCRDEAAAVAAFEARRGRPVAVKGCSASVVHKSELGIVRLGLGSSEAVKQAVREIRAAMAAAGADFDGCIVADMFKGRREFMVGARRDPVFGPVVLVGDGGKYVEALPDVQVLLAPFTPEDVLTALGKLRVAPLLAGVRGEPPLDRQALIDAVMAVGRLMTDGAANVSSLDINPLAVGFEGEGCFALDGVVYA